MTPKSELASRLRTETAELHARTESQLGAPAGVHSTADYIDLLHGMLTFHLAVEHALTQEEWRPQWREIGIEIHDHDRSHLIIRDLFELGAFAPEPHSEALSFGSFAEAVGCLYVVEGSSLGGQFIGPAIVQKLGPVPTAYYDGDGRQHPRPWRAVQAGLSAFGEGHNDDDLVIEGAVATFDFLGRLFSRESVKPGRGDGAP